MEVQITRTINFDEISSISTIELLEGNGRWSAKQLREEIDNKNNINLYLRLDHAVIGYLFCQVVDEEASLLKIVIKDSNKRKGFGTKMLEALVSELKALKVTILFIEVNSQNTGAIEFYKKNGFEFLYVRKKYYNEEDALIFSLKII